ncbi:SAM-dependent methyltransferase [Dactylosporangium sp. CA-092794]|uniref:SAM-dependent methyltransferase n=1 Tax=Dactylosporangium sp. CA-092794 TaxID=3239929 RepID=UPI003D934D08
MVGAEQANGTPPGIGMSRPNAARMYDFLLGGAHNFDADRRAALALLEVAPEIRDAAWANRRFLRRAVQYALDQGIRQFLDLGCGIPSRGNVHDVVRAAHPDGRVLYVDADPVVIKHAQVLLNDVDGAKAIQADLRDPAGILGHDQTHRLIDFRQPVTVLLVSVLHFVPGTTDELTALLGEFMRPAASGSLLVISHASPTLTTDATKTVNELYARTPTPLHLRSAHDIRALFGDLDLIAPDPHLAKPANLVSVSAWRPDPTEQERLPDRSNSPFLAGFLAGVGRNPRPAAAETVTTAGSADGTPGIPPRPRNDARFRDRQRAHRGAPTAARR